MKKILSILFCDFFLMAQCFGGGSTTFTGGLHAISVWGSQKTLSPDNAVTISCWVKSTSTGDRGIISKEKSDNSANTYYLTQLVTSGFAQFRAGQGNATGVNSTTAIANKGKWFYVAGTYDLSTRIIYVNGLQEATQANSAAIVDSNNSFIIGGRPNGSTGLNQFVGQIANVRVWNYALSASEILESYYCSDSPVSRSTGTLVANFMLWESTSPYKDLAGNFLAISSGSIGPSQDGPPINFCNGGMN